MKQDKGITLITLIMYIILTLVVLGILGMLSRNFRSNLNNVNVKTAQDVEHDKLNVQLLKETKITGNLIESGNSNNNNIKFKNGNTYTYNIEDKAVYLNNNIKIAENITELSFEVIDTPTKQTLTMKTTINNKTVVSEYVMSKTTLPPGQRVAETTEYIDTNGDRAWIPAGFVVSGIPEEEVIDDGLVIYKISEEELEEVTWDGTEKNKFDQFVWIPVNRNDINKMFICQLKTTLNGACNIVIENNVAKCTIHNSTKMAGRLFAPNYGETYKTGYTEVYTTGIGIREPDIVTGNSDGTGTSMDGETFQEGTTTKYRYLLTISNLCGNGYENPTNFRNTLQKDYNNAAMNIYKAEGFWVGRYETSNITNQDNSPVRIIAGTDSGISQANWYLMYAKQKTYASDNDVVGTQSSMIMGITYDKVMEFINSEAYDVTRSEYVGHTSSKFTKVPGKTGGVDYEVNYSGYQSEPYRDVSRNIYDMEGNVFEWTTEAYGTSNRVYRGGNYKDEKRSPSYRDDGTGPIYGIQYGRHKSNTTYRVIELKNN